MNIGGIQKCSLIDYPGKISLVVFTRGCNFFCPYCHNPELIKAEPDGRAFGSASPERAFDQEDFFRFLENRKNLLDGVVMSGGEPTLHHDLPQFIRRINDMGFLVKLDTNGSRPDVLEDIVKNGFADFIAMDVKTSPAHYEPFAGPSFDASAISRSVSIIVNAGIHHEFRTTCVHPLVTDSDIQQIARMVSGADSYVLKRPETRRVLDPDFFTHTGRPASSAELDHFLHILFPYVKQCHIR